MDSGILRRTLQTTYDDTLGELDDSAINSAYHSALRVQQQSLESPERTDFHLIQSLIRKYVHHAPSDTLLMSDTLNQAKEVYANKF